MKSLIFSFISLLFLNTAIADSVDQQIKVVFPNDRAPSFEEFIDDQGLSFQKHSQKTYAEIYLDTPKMDLYQKELSLKLRRTLNERGIFEYKMQLKSEVDPNQLTTYKLDDNNLNRYYVFYNHSWSRLTYVLDQLFVLAQKNTITKEDMQFKQNAINALTKWFHDQANSPIQLFYKLKMIFKSDMIAANLTPVFIGNSLSIQYHILGKEGHGFEMKNLNTKHDLLPKYFESNPNDTWVMEASNELTTLHCVHKDYGQKHVIKELKFENKYKSDNPIFSLEIMKQFNDQLLLEFNAKNEMNSKYRQTQKQFGAKRFL